MGGFMEVNCVSYGCKGKARFRPEKIDIQEIKALNWWEADRHIVGYWDESCSDCKEIFRLNVFVHPHFVNKPSPEISHASQR